jgi:hypothetical protein
MYAIFSVNILQPISKRENVHHLSIIHFHFSLGLIANSHLVLADQSPEGAKDIRCLTLARMHRYVQERTQQILTPLLLRNMPPV